MSSLVGGLARAINSVPHAAMPPVCEYEAWLAGRKARAPNGGERGITATLYRRIAQLRRMGDGWSEIGRCVGISGNTCVKRAWLNLPEHLR